MRMVPHAGFNIPWTRLFLSNTFQNIQYSNIICKIIYRTKCYTLYIPKGNQTRMYLENLSPQLHGPVNKINPSIKNMNCEMCSTHSAPVLLLLILTTLLCLIKCTLSVSLSLFTLSSSTSFLKAFLSSNDRSGQM